MHLSFPPPSLPGRRGFITYENVQDMTHALGGRQPRGSGRADQRNGGVASMLSLDAAFFWIQLSLAPGFHTRDPTCCSGRNVGFLMKGWTCLVRLSLAAFVLRGKVSVARSRSPV